MSRYHITECDKPKTSSDLLLVWIDEMGDDTSMVGYYFPFVGLWFVYDHYKGAIGKQVPEPTYWMEFDKELPNGMILS